MDSVYILKIPGGHEYVELINDIARFTIIQIAIQLMLVLMDSSRFSFFSLDFFMLLLFVNIGVLFYWLVFRKIVIFTSNLDDK